MVGRCLRLCSADDGSILRGGCRDEGRGVSSGPPPSAAPAGHRQRQVFEELPGVAAAQALDGAVAALAQRQGLGARAPSSRGRQGPAAPAAGRLSQIGGPGTARRAGAASSAALISASIRVSRRAPRGPGSRPCPPRAARAASRSCGPPRRRARCPRGRRRRSGRVATADAQLLCGDRCPRLQQKSFSISCTQASRLPSERSASISARRRPGSTRAGACACAIHAGGRACRPARPARRRCGVNGLDPAERVWSRSSLASARAARRPRAAAQ